MRTQGYYARVVVAGALGAALLSLLLLPPGSAAQSGGYDLTWSTIDDGGGTSSNSSYSLAGTISQPDAGALNSGNYTLQGGFWNNLSGPYQVYMPLVLR